MFKDYKYIEMQRIKSHLEIQKVNFICYDDNIVFGEYPDVPECFGDNDQESRNSQIRKDINQCVF